MLTILNSSIGRKITMALTGLFLVVFLFEHLYGNLLLYKSDGGLAFAEYSYELVHNLLIRIVEVVLFAAIFIHVLQAINLTRQNAAARPVKYAVNKSSETSNWFSRNMGLTGSLIFFFLVIHMFNFFVPYRISDVVGHEGQESIAFHVKEAFENPIYASLYLVATVLLGFHLNHGFQSALQTLGLNNKKYEDLLKKTATGIALLFTVGFGSFPVLFFFQLVGQSIVK